MGSLFNLSVICLVLLSLSLPGLAGDLPGMGSRQWSGGKPLLGEQMEEPFLTGDEVTYIKRVLRLINPEETLIDTLIENRHHMPQVDNLVKQLHAFRGAMMSYSDSISPSSGESNSGSSGVSNSGSSGESNSGSSGESNSGSSGVSNSGSSPSQTKKDDVETNLEDCVRDYDSYIGPLTDRFYNALRESWCEDEGIDDCNSTYPPVIELRNLTLWSGPFFDAHGKIPEGIGDGKIHFVGGHDMCLDQTALYNDSTGVEHTFDGLYCRITMTPNSLVERNISIGLLYGICAPNTCSKEMVYHYIYNNNTFLRHVLDHGLNISITKVYCGQELDAGTDTRFQVAVGMIVALAILNIIGTTYDGSFRAGIIRKKLMRKLGDTDSISSLDSQSSFLQQRLTIKHRIDLFLVAFSTYTNISKVFGSKEKRGYLRVLNGIKYLSFVWVVLGNTYLFGPIYQESFINANILTFILKFPRNFFFQFVINYPFNIDSFLTVSGVLVAWWWLRHFEGMGKKMTLRLAIRLSVRHIVRKYWQLAPALMLTLMFYTCLYRYFIDGPLYPSDIADAENCKVNWWVDMLMIHNLVRKSHICLSWMFYVPMVFQMHVAALVVLIPLVIWPVIGYIILALLFIANIIVTSVIFADLRGEEDIGRLFSDYLMAPWCRCGVYIIGMAYGIILHKTKCKIRINPFVNVLVWLLAIGSMAAIIFSTYDEFKEGGEYWSPSAHTAYDVISHPVWGLCIGWIILSSATGHGGVIAKFLEWGAFRALSRLVYTALLTSSLMIFRYVYSNRSLLYVDPMHHTYIFLGHLIYLVAMGTIFGLLWHYTLAIGLDHMVRCSSMKSWIRSGRYPPELKRVLERLDEKKKD